MVKKRKAAPVQEGPPDASAEGISELLLTKRPTVPARDSAKLSMQLLESATTRLVARMGWLRDVRLRRAADVFLKNYEIYQQASARVDAGDDAGGFEKPSPKQIDAYEADLKQNIEQLRTKLQVVPMNHKRDIDLKSAGPGSIIGKEKAKLKSLKERAVELDKKPKSVRKGSAFQKVRKGGKLKKDKAQASGEPEEDL
mmetsp:Transcript_20216/g.36655  ORF Transcript_20216/g.36655 Transcript_20216/m.36655 type:complete len:198 (-) Transcript_20216:38-631(-)